MTATKAVSPGTATNAGDTVVYSVTVTNNGTVVLTNVNVTEGALFQGLGTEPVFTCPSGPLAPGASVTCDAPYTVVQGDVNRGGVLNQAVAHGTDPTGAVVDSPPTGFAIVAISRRPALSAQKSVTPNPVNAAGQTVTYDVTLTNTGNVTLASPTVTETAFSGSGAAPVISCPPGSIAPQASVTCSGGYNVTQADITAGVVTNTAVGHGLSPNEVTVDSPPANATLAVVLPSPALTATKTADPQAVHVAGQQVTFTVQVDNTGNVPLEVAVAETAFSGTGTAPVISCPSPSLDPGDSMACTGTYVVTAADIASGKITNTATVTGTPPGGAAVAEDASTEVTVAQPQNQEQLNLVKSASPPVITGPGEVVTFSFDVVNTGAEPLTDLHVTDTGFSGTGQLGEITCPSTEVPPGGDVVCTAVYTVTDADVDAGRLRNGASVTARSVGQGGGAMVATATPITLHLKERHRHDEDDRGAAAVRRGPMAELPKTGDRTGSLTLVGLALLVVGSAACCWARGGGPARG